MQKLPSMNLKNEIFKFARSMLCNERRPDIKDGIGFQQGNQNNTKLNAHNKLSKFVKGKAPMVQDREGYILILLTILSTKLGKSMLENLTLFLIVLLCIRMRLPKKKIPNASNEHNISFKTFDASYVLTNKSGKVVVKYVGGKHKSPKTCVWVPKVLVSNVKGPKTVWVSKNKA
jgi:hypothetical protein